MLYILMYIWNSYMYKMINMKSNKSLKSNKEARCRKATTCFLLVIIVSIFTPLNAHKEYILLLYS